MIHLERVRRGEILNPHACRMDESYAVYILTNPSHTVLYVGSTVSLIGRVEQHRKKIVDSFTKKYHVTKLVYYESAETRYAALERERQIKKYRREKKDALIRAFNPGWRDLFSSLE